MGDPRVRCNPAKRPGDASAPPAPSVKTPLLNVKRPPIQTISCFQMANKQSFSQVTRIVQTRESKSETERAGSLNPGCWLYLIRHI